MIYLLTHTLANYLKSQRLSDGQFHNSYKCSYKFIFKFNLKFSLPVTEFQTFFHSCQTNSFWKCNVSKNRSALTLWSLLSLFGWCFLKGTLNSLMIFNGSCIYIRRK